MRRIRDRKLSERLRRNKGARKRRAVFGGREGNVLAHSTLIEGRFSLGTLDFKGSPSPRRIGPSGAEDEEQGEVGMREPLPENFGLWWLLRQGGSEGGCSFRFYFKIFYVRLFLKIAFQAMHSRKRQNEVL